MATKPKIAIVGGGSVACYMAPELAKLYDVTVYNSDKDFRQDGVTSNLARRAPAAPTPVAIVADATTSHPPMTNLWDDMYKVPDYTDSFVSQPCPALGGLTFPVYTHKNFGGNDECRGGTHLLPSSDLISEWASTSNDTRYTNTVLSKINGLTSYRTRTPSTAQTYNAQIFAPIDGPSATTQIATVTGGNVSLVQLAESELGDNFSNALHNQVGSNLPVYPTAGVDSATTQNLSVNSATPQSTSNAVPSPVAPSTYNAGTAVSLEVPTFSTTAQESTVDIYRARTSLARSLKSVIQNKSTNPADVLPAPYNPTGYINKGTILGRNGLPLKVELMKTINRIVFKTIPGKPLGQNYWIHTTPMANIKPADFVQPLQAIGIEYGATMGTKTFVPFDHVIIAADVMGSVGLLHRSGIGPAAVLNAAPLNLPCLLDLPVGKKVVGKAGFRMRMTASNALVGDVPAGTFEPDSRMPSPASSAEPSPRKRRVRHKLYKEAAANTYVAKLTLERPRSTGEVQATANWLPSTAQAVKYTPNYFSATEDIADICHAVRRTAAAMVALDPATTFQNPAMTNAQIQSSTNAALFAALHANPADFVSKNEFIGGASMGAVLSTLNPKPVTNINGKIAGTANLRITSSAATPLVRDKAGGVNVAIPAADGDRTRNNLAHATILLTALKSTLA